MTNNQTKRVVLLGLLVAVEVVLSRFLSIPTPILKISFAFIPIAVAGMLYGPVGGMLVGGVGDFIGAILFPIGPYFIGYTITATLTGLVYGLFLYKKEHALWRALVCSLLVNLVLHLGLNTYWVSLFVNKGYWALIPERVIKSMIMVPVQTVILGVLRQQLTKWDTVLFPS